MLAIKTRLKNYGFWVSLFALIPMALNTFGINILPASYDSITKTLLTLLVLLGLVNNPTTLAKWYLDDKKVEPAVDPTPAPVDPAVTPDANNQDTVSKCR